MSEREIIIRTFLRSSCRVAAVAVAAAALSGCDVNTALEELTEARRLSADLLVEFTGAADASNRAVMADTDETSLANAREAEQATAAVQNDVESLRPLLETLRFSEEAGILKEFDARFAEYRTLDRTILDLAVENTNLKAQRLSFDAAQRAADAFSAALEGLAPSNPARDAWQTRALAAAAVARVREIQALQAPHIAEADETTMAALEKRMASAEADARTALKSLAGLIEPGSRSRLTAASTALQQLMDVNAQIVELSRRNSNVRSLALSLNEKAPLVDACEDQLRALQAALAKRGFSGNR